MKSLCSLVILLLFYGISTTPVLTHAAAKVKPQHVTCYNRGSKCFLKSVNCPTECPSVHPKDSSAAKQCFLDCYSPKCEAVCKSLKPNCDGPGAACYDPRFIGGDGIVFYFHGKRNEHFSLISDTNLQINARFIGLRPAGRMRDYTWIQALGLKFGPHNFTLQATKAKKWDDGIDHLEFKYNERYIEIPEGQSSEWTSPDSNIRVERTSIKNSVTVEIPGLVAISANVVPITEEENMIHNYQIPSNDCFAHLEVQFRFVNLSPRVEGVLGRTYQPDFVNPAKPGVAMAVVGGDDRYKTSALLSADCNSCIFNPKGSAIDDSPMLTMYGSLDCTGQGGIGSGGGIVCKK